MEETFTLLPLSIPPEVRPGVPSTVACPSLEHDEQLTTELAHLNMLHRALLALPAAAHQTPPPPVPVHPQRSAQVTKLRESGNAAFRKAAFPEAIRMYTFGIEMALGRPSWEPSGLVRDEASALYANRAQAHMALRQWVEGATDAECSVEMKRVGNGKGWWRRGKCLMEMGKLEDARAWLERGLEVEGEEGEVAELAREVERNMEAGKSRVPS